MNANINYDEIPDTSAVQEDLLAVLSSQHVTVHTNEEPDFDYMENEDVAFVGKNPHNEERICSLNWAESFRCSSACGMGSTRPWSTTTTA